MKIGNLEKLRNIKSYVDYIEEIKLILQSSREELEKRILETLNIQLEYAGKNSPFYIERSKQGKMPRKIKALAELSEIQFTTKKDLRNAYPFGFIAVPRSRIIRYGESTGTTGSPTSSFMTRDEWERDNLWTTLSYMNFFSEEDMVFIAIPYELAFASVAFEKAFWNIGATVVAVGTLNMVCPWERTLKMMRVLHPSVLICTPTRALRLHDKLTEAGHDPGEVKLKTLFYAGETCSSAKLNKIAKLWNINILTAYGTTETNALSLPCQYGNQHLVEDRYYFEVIDPESGRPIEGKSRGELVITSLVAEAMPLIRYRTGDIVCIEEEPCPCGVPFRRLQHYGRYNEKITIGNNNILKIDLEEAILSVEGTGCYYAAAAEDDVLQILVELVGADKRRISEAVYDKVLKRFGVKPSVHEANREAFCKAMDNMLKPGSLSLKQIKEINKV